MSLRVLYSYPLRLGRAGIGTTAWQQVYGLLQQGVQVSLFCGSCEKSLSNLDYLKEFFQYGNIRFPIRLLGKKAYILFDRMVSRALRRSTDSFDIIHCWPSAALETLTTARELGIKTVLERPNSHTRYAYEVVRKEYERLVLKQHKSSSHTFDLKRLRREEEEFKLADRLLCPSEFVAKTFLDLGFDRQKIALSQYGYDPSSFSFHHVNSSKINEQPFSILFAGMCEPRKGLHYALEAWLKSKASQTGKFYICGGYVPKYRKLLSNMLNHPSIEEVGFTSDISSFMNKCHVLILSSIEEGSALVTYEARACGCVLLVSEATGSRCTHMNDGMIHKVGDVSALKEHIDLLFSDHHLYLKLRKNSLERLNQLTWQSAAEVLVKIYQDSLK